MLVIQNILNIIMNNEYRDSIANCLTQQLSEFELLCSMYPDSGEIILTDKNIIDDINVFLLGSNSDFIPNHLEFVLNICINELKFEICMNLPSMYPEEEPDIYLRCNQINGQQETNLNSSLTNYLKSNHAGEVCLYTAILWLQENFETYCTQETSVIINDEESDGIPEKENSFVRLWIFSHHIYNKKKREAIMKNAKELNVTGFCLPGKPGIICIEGLNSDCNEWWKKIKSMNWKKIVIRKTEIFDLCEQNEQKKFYSFEEIAFSNKNSSNNKHANMSDFSKYMNNLGLSKCFNEFFGICNDTL